MSKTVVMHDSSEAASIKTVTGWVSRDGQFWGDDERMARYCGATHRQCENNPNHPIIAMRDYCELCHTEERHNRFNAMERQQWDRECQSIVMLVPNDTSVGWFKLAMESVDEVRLIMGGRIQFVPAGVREKNSSNPKGSMLLIWR
ncbi:DNA N-6-adenine-methyltransferase, partial [Xenorhabdus bovienii]|uniref:DNA N-6-adenine-methyltransferase n=1 Tax=Xenorhabdus bovienii TaxID=40576 RepID=UPI003DA4D156